MKISVFMHKDKERLSVSEKINRPTCLPAHPASTLGQGLNRTTMYPTAP
jgi:hypothetical protein